MEASCPIFSASADWDDRFSTTPRLCQTWTTLGCRLQVLKAELTKNVVNTSPVSFCAFVKAREILGQKFDEIGIHLQMSAPYYGYSKQLG
jgi:hypothetical protein